MCPPPTHTQNRMEARHSGKVREEFGKIRAKSWTKSGEKNKETPEKKTYCKFTGKEKKIYCISKSITYLKPIHKNFPDC